MLSPRYDVEPDARELMVIKKLVFGCEEYAPAAMCDFLPRYAVEPEADELIT